MSAATAESLFGSFQAHPNRFSAPGHAVGTVADFRDTYSIPLRDFNTAGVAAAHMGTPLSQLQAGIYNIHGQQVTVAGPRVQECRNAVDAVVARI
jgi:hypothetical protein